MPITKEEVDSAISLYDLAMTGNMDALFAVIDLFDKGTAGDPTAEGLAWAICMEADKRDEEAKKKQNKTKN